MSIHKILAAVIILLLGVSACRFLLWNRGSASLYDPSAVNTAAYSTEVQDLIVPVTGDGTSIKRAEGEPLTVLCLGGNPWTDNQSGTGLAGQIEALSGCRTVSAAFPDSRVTCLNRSYDPSTPEGMDDIFNLFYVSYSLCNGDFQGLLNVASTKDDPVFLSSVEALMNTDLTAVDIILIAYDGTDYRTGAPLSNDNPRDLTSYAGSLLQAAELLRKTYPDIRIVFMTPTYELYKDAQGNVLDPVHTDLGNGEMPSYIAAAYTSCSAALVSCIDNYSGSVNAINYERFLNPDGTLNEDGCHEVARHFVTKIIEDDPAEYQPPK